MLIEQKLEECGISYLYLRLGSHEREQLYLEFCDIFLSATRTLLRHAGGAQRLWDMVESDAIQQCSSKRFLIDYRKVNA